MCGIVCIYLIICIYVCEHIEYHEETVSLVGPWLLPLVLVLEGWNDKYIDRR